MMNRHTFVIGAAASPIAANGADPATQPGFDPRDLTSLRLLISVGANRAGVLSERSTLFFLVAWTGELRYLNIPRAEPGASEWRWSIPPPEPPFSPAYHSDDVVYDRAPDDVTAQTRYRDGVALALSRRAGRTYLAYYSPSSSQIATYDLGMTVAVKALYVVPNRLAIVFGDNRESMVPFPSV
jgi:hypothetical protein